MLEARYKNKGLVILCSFETVIVMVWRSSVHDMLEARYKNNGFVIFGSFEPVIIMVW